MERPLRRGRIEFSTVFNKGPFKFGRKKSGNSIKQQISGLKGNPISDGISVASGHHSSPDAQARERKQLMNQPNLWKDCNRHLNSSCCSETQLKVTFKRQQGNYVSWVHPKVKPCLRHNNEGNFREVHVTFPGFRFEKLSSTTKIKHCLCMCLKTIYF